MFDLAVAFATAASGLVAGSMLTLVIKRRTGVTGNGAGADDALSDFGRDCEDGLVICKESALMTRCVAPRNWVTGAGIAPGKPPGGARFGAATMRSSRANTSQRPVRRLSPSTRIGPGLSRRSVAQLRLSRKVYSTLHR